MRRGRRKHNAVASRRRGRPIAGALELNRANADSDIGGDAYAGKLAEREAVEQSADADAKSGPDAKSDAGADAHVKAHAAAYADARTYADAE